MQIVYMPQLSVFLRKTITTLLWLAGGVVFFRWLLAPLLPFLLALALSAMVEPLVQRLRRKMKVKRAFAAALVTTGLLLVLGGTVTALLVRLGIELQEWSGRLPAAVERFPAVWNGLLDRIGAWYAACPSFLRSALDALAGQVMEDGPGLAGEVGSWLMGEASALLSALPDAGLFLMTTVLAVYFTSLRYPEILAFLKRQLPPSWQVRCRDAGGDAAAVEHVCDTAGRFLVAGAGLRTAGGGFHRAGGRPAGAGDRYGAAAVGGGVSAGGEYGAGVGAADPVCGGSAGPHASGTAAAGGAG